MNITIFDKNEQYIEVLNKFIKANPEFDYIKTEVIDVKDLKCDILVTAGNSFGVMGGGIDLVIRNLIPGIEKRVQLHIKHYKQGVLLVGEALKIETDYKQIPHLIYAPTMFLPTILPQGSENALIATIAALKKRDWFRMDCGVEYDFQRNPNKSIYIPIFCVNSGKMNIWEAVTQMCLGIDLVVKGCNITTHNDMVELYNRMKSFKYE